jgi:oxaloacetate decarboxylase beta subunit
MGFVSGTWQNYVMLLISFILMYLAIVKKFEPMLLLPIAFGMFLINLPGAEDVVWGEYPEGGGTSYEDVIASSRGLLWYLYFGVDKVIYPPLIFLGIGCMTDFGPLIANPKSMLIGAGAQLGVFVAFVLAVLLGFSVAEAASIAIIGGADGPTAIYVTSKLANDYIPMIAIAAYSYMALIPLIQKPLMRLLTTKKERTIRMKQLRQVSKLEKIIFPLIVTLVVGIILPSSLALLGMLMLGNLFRESGVVERLSSQAQNGLMNTITIFLGIAVGCKAKGEVFLQVNTIYIICLGLFAFIMGTIGGLLVAKLMCKLTGGKINPLIGSAGVSAVPMAARISEDVGREYDPQNHLLMHAMGPNVAGVIGSAIAAGVLLACFGGYVDGTAVSAAVSSIIA